MSKLRTYDELVSAICCALPSDKELDTLSDEQVQTLRRFGNTFDNVLYMRTREWKEYRARVPAGT